MANNTLTLQVIILEISYLSVLLVYPIVLIQWVESMALPGTYFMLFTVSIFLKLTSFHHVCYDNRRLVHRVKKGKKEETAAEDLATMFNVNKRTFDICMKYPNNLDLGHYLRFMMAPTCCYQMIYPTSPNIRVSYLFKHIFSFILGYIFMFYLISQHMIPIANESIIHFKTRNYL